MSAPSPKRAQNIDYVAENLIARASLLVRLLIKQVHDRSFVRTEMEVLVILADGPRTISELTELAGVAQPSMTALVKRMEARGWVERKGVPDDGRVVLVSLRPNGAEARDQYRERFLDAMRTDLDALSDRELAALVDATKTLNSFVGDLQARSRRT